MDQETVFISGMTASFVAAVLLNYLVLYVFKWAGGKQLLWEGFGINLIWLITFILTTYAAFNVINLFRLSFNPGIKIFLGAGFLFPALSVSGILWVLKRGDEMRRLKPNIWLVAVMVGGLSVLLILGSLYLNFAVTDFLFPTPPESDSYSC